MQLISIATTTKSKRHENMALHHVVLPWHHSRVSTQPRHNVENITRSTVLSLFLPDKTGNGCHAKAMCSANLGSLKIHQSRSNIPHRGYPSCSAPQCQSSSTHPTQLHSSRSAGHVKGYSTFCDNAPAHTACAPSQPRQLPPSPACQQPPPDSNHRTTRDVASRNLIQLTGFVGMPGIDSPEAFRAHWSKAVRPKLDYLFGAGGDCGWHLSVAPLQCILSCSAHVTHTALSCTCTAHLHSSQRSHMWHRSKPCGTHRSAAVTHYKILIVPQLPCLCSGCMQCQA